MTSRVRPDVPYRVDDFFGLRTPILPFTDYLDWTGALKAARACDRDEELGLALAEDRRTLRRALQEMLCRPEVREAVYLGSPTLEQGIGHWLEAPDSPRGQATELVLMRYSHRLTQRCTPFGLFASHAMGRMGRQTRLDVGAPCSHGRETGLDWWYLAKLIRHFSASRALRESVNCYPNTSIYPAAGRLRYTEYVVDEHGQRHYQLVAVDDSPALQALLMRARGGRKAAELALQLAEDEEVAFEEALDFIHSLIDCQILVTDLEPRPTGVDAAAEFAEHLCRCPDTAGSGEVIVAALAEMAAMDREGTGQSPERYRRLVAAFETLPVPVDPSMLLQVDLFGRTSAATLGPEVVAELERTVAMLHRLAPRSVWDPLEEFKAAFRRRHEDRWLPLLEVLDQESGIGFPPEAQRPTPDAPLLRGLMRGADDAGASRRDRKWSTADLFMLQRVRDLANRGVDEWVLDEDDLRALEGPPPLPGLADSVTAFATLLAASPEGVAEGDFRLHLRHCYGPSGARLLSRFCKGDRELFEHTSVHLRREEEFRPDAVYAEIAFLPQPRVGNVLARPVLREHEIVFLARSGAPTDRQILLSDLLVSVVEDRVVLYSKSLAREVVPRISSAAKFEGFVGIYEFLGHLQDQGTAGPLRWRWGALEDEPFLPRVTYGRTVLARAQWTIEAADFSPVLAATGAQRFRLAQAWRARRRLPRLTVLVEDDNDLLLDLDNTLNLDTFCDVVRKKRSFILAEAAMDADRLLAQGPEGRYIHELVIPMLRTGAEPVARGITLPRSDDGSHGLVETFPPGSEWLFLKLYGGQGNADRVLVDTVAATIDALQTEGLVDGWFFIRYEDPDPHLRLRLHGDADVLCGQALPAMNRRLRPLLDNGMLWRIEVATYQRESVRYGGLPNMGRAERLFEFDSEAALAITRHCSGDGGADHRWQLVLAGMDRWLADFGLDLDNRYRFARHARDAYARERTDAARGLEAGLSQRFRTERPQLESLLDHRYMPEDESLRAGFAALARRSVRSAPMIAEIVALQQAGQLSTTVESFAHSLIHMFVNRALRSAQRQQELVLYDFLCRLYRSRLARARPAKALSPS